MADERVQVGGDEDTVDRFCALCQARQRVESELVRAGVTRATIVLGYQRPKVGPHAVQTATALLAFPDGDIQRGEGSCLEEALVDALERSGRTPA